jgi:hypothetical protein
MEARELLNKYNFPGDKIPIIRGSALKTLEGDAAAEAQVISSLMKAVDDYIPPPNAKSTNHSCWLLKTCSQSPVAVPLPQVVSSADKSKSAKKSKSLVSRYT